MGLPPPNRTFVTQEGNKSGKDEAVSAVSRTRQRERERERERDGGVEEGAMTMGTTYHRTPMKSKGSGKESAKKANFGKSTQR